MRKAKALLCIAAGLAGVALFASAAAAAAPNTRPDFVKTPENKKVTFGVIGNDSPTGGDRVSVSTLNIDTFPSNGLLELSLEGKFTYTPDPGYVGPDSFQYVVCSAKNFNQCSTETVTITVGDVAATTTTAPPAAPASTPPPVAQAADANALPRTGSANGPLLAAGVALCGSGALLLGAARRRGARASGSAPG